MALKTSRGPYIIAAASLDAARGLLSAYPTGIITAGSPTGGGPYWLATKGASNAQRIVACVNACEGLTNEALDGKSLKAILIDASEAFYALWHNGRGLDGQQQVAWKAVQAMLEEKP